MSEQENISIVRRQFDILNKHDVKTVEKDYADNFRGMATGAPGELNREQNSQYTRQYIEAFPDLHFDLKDVIAQGNKVAAFWVGRGTHKAPLVSSTGETIPPTNRMTSVPGCTLYEFKNDKIVRQDILWDQVTLLTQLGIMTGQQQTSRSMR